MIVTQQMANEAWALLEEKSGLTKPAGFPYGPPSVMVAYRAAAKNTHPDAGGTAEMFAAVDRAKHVLLEWLRRQSPVAAPDHGPRRKCHMCDGKGFVMSHKGFRSLRASCGACRGTGDFDTEHDHGDGR